MKDINYYLEKAEELIEEQSYESDPDYTLAQFVLDKALIENPKCAKAYLLLACIDFNTVYEDLENEEDLFENKNFKLARKYAEGDIKEEINDMIQNNIDEFGTSLYKFIKCPYCKSDILSDSLYCSYCGTKLNK